MNTILLVVGFFVFMMELGLSIYYELKGDKINSTQSIVLATLAYLVFFTGNI